MTELLDHRGKPIPTSQLTREIGYPTARGVRQTARATTATGLTPATLGAILENAANGDMDQFLTLAEEMEERDAHYSAVLQTRKLQITSLPRWVRAASDSPEDVRLQESVLALTREPAFAGLLMSLLDAIAKGKHLYCEKPLCRTVYETRRVTEAARKAGVATQLGNFGHSSEDIRLACEWIWDGAIGDVHDVYSWTSTGARRWTSRRRSR